MQQYHRKPTQAGMQGGQKQPKPAGGLTEVRDSISVHEDSLIKKVTQKPVTKEIEGVELSQAVGLFFKKFKPKKQMKSTIDMKNFIKLFYNIFFVRVNVNQQKKTTSYIKKK